MYKFVNNWDVAILKCGTEHNSCLQRQNICQPQLAVKTMYTFLNNWDIAMLKLATEYDSFFKRQNIC